MFHIQKLDSFILQVEEIVEGAYSNRLHHLTGT